MKVIVIGGSAGSLPVLIRLAQELPAAVLVVLLLPQLLQAPGCRRPMPAMASRSCRAASTLRRPIITCWWMGVPCV